MSNTTLNWQFHDDHGELDPGEPKRRRRSIPWRRILIGIIFGAVILAVAGVAGFWVGRYQRATTAARADLQAAIDIETWAWQSGNRQLFTSTIDLAAKGDWRRDLERQFDTQGKDIRAVTLKSFRFMETDLTEVEVDVLGARGLEHERRHYRLINGQWKRTSKS